MQVSDDLWLGGFQGGGLTIGPTSSADPTINQGIGPMGRTAYLNIVPLTAQTNNLATTQHMTAATGLTLTAGTGVTSGPAPDGSGSTVLIADVERCPSLTSTANLSAINFTVTGYDQYMRKATSKIAGPNNNTVVFPKAFLKILSIVPDTTDGANNVTAGLADVFGLQFAITDAVYIQSIKWAGSLALDPGVLTVADTTSPATVSTGDPCGTYAPSSASNGTNRLVIGMHLNAGQVGPNATQANAVGVTPV